VNFHLAFKTLINEFGVLQNPTGWHEGKRVWGGGVVKDKNVFFSDFNFNFDFILINLLETINK